MIKKQTIYEITFTEQQAKELYELLSYEKDTKGPSMSIEKDLRLIYDELARQLYPVL